MHLDLELIEEVAGKLEDLRTVRSLVIKQKALGYMRKPLEDYTTNDFRRIDAKIYKIKRSIIKQERAQGNVIARSAVWD